MCIGGTRLPTRLSHIRDVGCAHHMLCKLKVWKARKFTATKLSPRVLICRVLPGHPNSGILCRPDVLFANCYAGLKDFVPCRTKIGFLGFFLPQRVVQLRCCYCCQNCFCLSTCFVQQKSCAKLMLETDTPLLCGLASVFFC